MKANHVQLGIEVGSSSPVWIPVRHMAVTGQTQESGKTTALEALITRSCLPAIAFLTKRGERSFTNARQVLPYFQDRGDWQFVQSILEFTMKERMKFERAWIVRACQGAHSLADVQRKLPELQAKSRNSMSQDIYMLLGEYLSQVVPLIASLPKSSRVDIRSGELSVVDLVSYPEELQVLVIASTLEWIHKHEQGVITVIPEAWKFIPQGRNTPVRMVAEKLLREGAALKNYVWIDSQDMAAVDKMLLRGCAVWLIGVQREANEIKRALSNMPAGLKKPNPGDVATLEIGQFFACYGREIRKTYVQPAWMTESAAIQIAQGRLNVHDVAPPQTSAQSKNDVDRMEERTRQEIARDYYLASGRGNSAPSKNEEEDMEWKDRFETEKRRADKLELDVEVLKGQLELMRNGRQDLKPIAIAKPVPSVEGYCGTDCTAPSEDRLVNAVLAQVRRDPLLIKLSQESPAIEVTINRTIVKVDDSNLKGKIAVLIADGYCSVPFDFTRLKQELVRRGLDSKTPNVRLSQAINDYIVMGLFWRTGSGWELAPGAKARVTAA